MKGYVVDASVAVKWVIAEPLSEQAVRLLDPDLQLSAPDLIYIEVASALWAAARRGHIADADARDAFGAIADAPLSIGRSTKQLARSALRLAQDLNHPVYDCMYLALAMEEQRRVITADRRFFGAVRDHPYLSKYVTPLESFGVMPSES